MFVDQALIQIRSGKGGDGCVSFRREKYVPKGGPDGGDGGDGGSVIFTGDPNITTLVNFRGKHHYKAQNGEPGRGSQQHGANGQDCIINVPPGTLIFDRDTSELLADVTENDRITLLKGGKGGFGNEHFKSATNQTPSNTTPGQPAQVCDVRLDLKLIADIGFIGKPNAGKSTLLAALTRATPKIADYPFTTLSPQLGIASLDASRRLVLADIPGLIEGAASGAGLGHDFLRHVERTRVLVHVLDVTATDATPAENYMLIREEMFRYAPELANKPELIVLNKMDLLPDQADQLDAMLSLTEELGLKDDQNRVLTISGATHMGLKVLMERLWKMVNPEDQIQGWKLSTSS